MRALNLRAYSFEENIMSRSLGNVIADSLALGTGYADRLLAEVSPEQFARFATPGGQVIESNHPCFILGHLALYPTKIVEVLSDQAPSVVVPDAFEQVFSKDAKCVDDPDGTIYPAMDEVVGVFRSAYSEASEQLRAASDEQLGQPNPNVGRMADLFPSIGSMHAFYCGGHIMLHMGQFSAWRRAMGMGPA